MTEKVEKTADGAMIFDRLVISEMSEARFSPEGWLHAEPVSGALGSAGRGDTLYIGNIPRQFVMRHYVRGGLIGRFVRDHYLWTGEDGTRPFREWRLLAKLADRGLNVPRPAAARYRRRGPFYTADLITVRIPGVRPLSARITEKRRSTEFWASVGTAIAGFHREGVCHADLNAYNIQVDDAGRIWLLDFDRGRLAEPGPWQQKTLARLHRSLEKVRRLDPRASFTAADWDSFLAAYFEASRSA